MVLIIYSVYIYIYSGGKLGYTAKFPWKTLKYFKCYDSNYRVKNVTTDIADFLVDKSPIISIIILKMLYQIKSPPLLVLSVLLSDFNWISYQTLSSMFSNR